MTNDDKILNILETLQQGQQEQGAAIARLEQGQKQLEQGQAQTNTIVAKIKTVVETLAAGQQDIREQVKTMSGKVATKADVQDIKADLVKQQRRIENVEENTKTPNPHKN